MRILYLMVLMTVIFLTPRCKKNFDDILSDSLVQKDYVAVRVVDLEETSESIPIYAIGRVSSDTETKLSYKTGGYISRLYAREGDYVKKGKLMGRLRTDEIDNQVLKATRALEKGQRDLKRVQAMYEDQVATIENVQDLKTLVDVNEADLKIATYNQRFSKILAPISGRVLRRHAEPNELVSPGQPIFVIASSGRQSYIMTISISDKDINLVSYGTKAELTFDAFADEKFDGTVNRIAESANPMTGTFEIELNINVKRKRIRNGMIGKVTLLPASQSDYIKIPTVSLSEGQGNTVTIYVPDEEQVTAIKKTVDVVRFAQDHVWIDKNQLEESRVITYGSAYLIDGQQIKIIE